MIVWVKTTCIVKHGLILGGNNLGVISPMDKPLSQQQIYVSAQIDILYCERKWAYPPTTSGCYSRQGGKPVDEIQVGFKIFTENSLQVKLLELCHCNVTTVLELHFSWLLSSKFI